MKLVATAIDRDGELLERVARGDTQAIGALYQLHARSLLRFAARAVGPAEAEDLVHAAFIRAADRASTFDPQLGSARGWLFGITGRLVQERRRALSSTARALLRFGAGAARAMTGTSNERHDLERALASLSEAKRVVILLAEVEGYTGEEIATMLEIPVGTVWTRLHKARRELRAFMEER